MNEDSSQEHLALMHRVQRKAIAETTKTWELVLAQLGLFSKVDKSSK